MYLQMRISGEAHTKYMLLLTLLLTLKPSTWQKPASRRAREREKKKRRKIIKCVRFVRKINANTEENYYITS